MEIKIEDELAGVDFKDKRLNERAKKMASILAREPNGSIPTVCKSKGELEAAYRFFRNEKVTPEEVIRSHNLATIERIKVQDIVGLNCDTTEMSHLPSIEGLGELNKKNTKGYYLHPTIAVALDGLQLGVAYADYFLRDGKKKKKHRNQLPLEEKESYRWLLSYRESCKIGEQCPNTLLVHVADRESDIYECLLEGSENKDKCHILIRAQHNRMCDDIEELECIEKIKDKIGKTQSLGRVVVPTCKSIDGQPRQATLEIKAKQVLIGPPSLKKGQEKFHINAVYLQEIDTPKGVNPISWLLLTTLAIDDFEKLSLIIKLYANRFKIEVFFRVLKTGCKVEKLRFDHIDTLLPCVFLYMIIAWRVLYITTLCRTFPQVSCSLILEEEEWQVLYIVLLKKEPPQEAPYLEEAYKLIARAGGHVGNIKTRPPGAEVIWRGLTFMYTAADTMKSIALIKTKKSKRCVVQ